MCLIHRIRIKAVILAEIMAEKKQESSSVNRSSPRPFLNEAWSVYTCLPRSVNADAVRLSRLTTASALSKAREAEHADRQLGAGIVGEIGEDFPHH